MVPLVWSVGKHAENVCGRVLHGATEDMHPICMRKEPTCVRYLFTLTYLHQERAL